MTKNTVTRGRVRENRKVRRILGAAVAAAALPLLPASAAVIPDYQGTGLTLVEIDWTNSTTPVADGGNTTLLGGVEGQFALPENSPSFTPSSLWNWRSNAFGIPGLTTGSGGQGIVGHGWNDGSTTLVPITTQHTVDQGNYNMFAVYVASPTQGGAWGGVASRITGTSTFTEVFNTERTPGAQLLATGDGGWNLYGFQLGTVTNTSLLSLDWAQHNQGQRHMPVALGFTLATFIPNTEWNLTTGGSWNNAGNWTDGVPNGDTDVPLFGQQITSPSTVTLDSSATVGGIRFNNGANSYTIAAAGASTLTLAGEARVDVMSGSHEVSAPIAGASGLTKTGTGTLVLSGANTYTGATQVQGGVLNVTNLANGGASSSIGAASSDASNLVLQSGTLQYTGEGDSADRLFTLAQSGGMLASSGDGAISFTNTGAMGLSGSGTRTLTLGGSNTGDNTLAASIGDQGGATSINKTGAGTWVLSGSNTYTGTTSVNGGALRVAHAGALGDISGATSISGGTSSARLEIAGGINLAEPLNLGGRQPATDAPHVVNVSGNNTLSGNITGQLGGNRYNFESAAGTLTIAGNIAPPGSADRVVHLGGAGDGTVSGAIQQTGTASVSVVKSGAGTWALGAGTGNTFTGPTIINEGTLQITPDPGTTDTGAVLSNRISVNAGGTLDVSDFSEYRLQENQTLEGSGTVMAQNIRTFGDNAIQPGLANQTGTLKVQGNLTLTNEFATSDGGLFFNLGSDQTVGAGVNDLIDVTGNLTVGGPAGAVPVKIVPLAALSAGQYRLIDYGGTLSGGVSDFSVADIGRHSFSIDTSTAGQVNLNVTGSAANLVWQGTAVSNVWDVQGAANWDNNGATDAFFDFDSVRFDDSASETTVDVTAVVRPGGVVVDASQNYTFTGSGRISGFGGLTKSGSGTLTLAGSAVHDYIGTTTINGGTLEIAYSGGAVTIPQPIANNSRLVFNRTETTTVTGELTGSGVVEHVAAGILLFNNDNSDFEGEIIVSGGGRIEVPQPNSLGGSAARTTIMSGSSMAVWVSNPEEIPAALELNGTGGPAPALGAALRVGGASTNTFSGPVTLGSSSHMQFDGGTNVTFTGGFSSTTDASLSVNNDGGATSTFSGPMNIGAGGVSKTGGGTMILSGDSSYTGGTTVTAGLLRVGHGNALGNGPLAITAPGRVVVDTDLGSAVTVTSVSISGETSLDLSDNELLVANGDVAAINALVISGRNGGTWGGPGINSSAAAAASDRDLGIGMSGNDVRVKFTFSGDATLDGAVTIADLGVLAANWQGTDRFWFQGDFNYDSNVTIADLGILAANWQKGASAGGMSFEEALAMFDVFDGIVVPEPGAMALVGLGTLLMGRRRRRAA